MAGRRVGPKVSKAGELSLPFTYCGIWKNEPYTSLGSIVELVLVMDFVGNLTLRVWA